MLSSVRAYVGRHHIGLLALFIALGGTSYAAIKLPANNTRPRNQKLSVKVRFMARSIVRDFLRVRVAPGSALP